VFFRQADVFETRRFGKLVACHYTFMHSFCIALPPARSIYATSRDEGAPTGWRRITPLPERTRMRLWRKGDPQQISEIGAAPLLPHLCCELLEGLKELSTSSSSFATKRMRVGF
jgi:hypothetical protein